MVGLFVGLFLLFVCLFQVGDHIKYVLPEIKRKTFRRKDFSWKMVTTATTTKLSSNF